MVPRKAVYGLKRLCQSASYKKSFQEHQRCILKRNIYNSIKGKTWHFMLNSIICMLVVAGRIHSCIFKKISRFLHSFIFIHLFINCLLRTYYVLGTVLGIWNIAGNKSDKCLAFMEDYQKKHSWIYQFGWGVRKLYQASCFLEWD